MEERPSQRLSQRMHAWFYIFWGCNKTHYLCILHKLCFCIAFKDVQHKFALICLLFLKGFHRRRAPQWEMKTTYTVALMAALIGAVKYFFIRKHLYVLSRNEAGWIMLILMSINQNMTGSWMMQQCIFLTDAGSVFASMTSQWVW